MRGSQRLLELRTLGEGEGRLALPYRCARSPRSPARRSPARRSPARRSPARRSPLPSDLAYCSSQHPAPSGCRCRAQARQRVGLPGRAAPARLGAAVLGPAWGGRGVR
eukprot:7022684-Prymnesium_polylepis.1